MMNHVRVLDKDPPFYSKMGTQNRIIIMYPFGRLLGPKWGPLDRLGPNGLRIGPYIVVTL